MVRTGFSRTARVGVTLVALTCLTTLEARPDPDVSGTWIEVTPAVQAAELELARTEAPFSKGLQDQRPSFAGTWIPSEPARSSVFFDNGLGWVPGNGRLVIEQRPARLTVTRHVPDDILDPLLAIQGQYYPTIIYRIAEARGRAGGSGAGGDFSGSSWQGSRLIVTRKQTGKRLTTVSLSLDGDRLKMETHVVILGEGKESTMTEWFTRTK